MQLQKQLSDITIPFLYRLYLPYLPVLPRLELTDTNLQIQLAFVRDTDQ
jgi:hypothetical protein